MSSEELYIYVQDLINKNSTNSKSYLSKREFVSLYKINSIKYVNYLLNNRNDDLIRTIANLREYEDIDFVEGTEQFDKFSFPEDYLNFINVSSTLKNDECSGIQTEVMTEIKPEEADKYYNDAYNEPSIKYAETLYAIYGEGLIVYKKGFDIKNVTLYYYRKPAEIDLEGYEKLDGEQSENIDPDMSDSALIEVANMIAKQFAGATENLNQFQVIAQTQQTKK